MKKRENKKHLRLGNFKCRLDLVDFDGGIDLSDEEEGRVEADCPSQEPEGNEHDEGVGEVKEGGDELVNLQFGVEVENTVSENVNSRSARDNEAPPPPMVIFRAELKVDHDDADLRARDDEDDEDEEQESEEIVELVFVDGREDEEELDKACSKRQDSGHQSAKSGMHVPDLIIKLKFRSINSFPLFELTCSGTCRGI